MKNIILVCGVILLSVHAAVASTFTNPETQEVAAIDIKTDNFAPQPYSPIEGKIDEIAMGENHICINQLQGIRCWGGKDYKWPTQNLGQAKSLVAGAYHTCFISNNQIICAGNNDFGQIKVPTNIKNPKTLAAGKSHTCTIDDEGVKCWGNNKDGQLTAPTDLKNPRLIAVSDTQSCVIDDEGVKCWGKGLQVKHQLKKPTMISGGASHFCTSDSRLFECWGEGLGAKHNIQDVDYNKILSLTSGKNITCFLLDPALEISCINYNRRHPSSIKNNLKNPSLIASYGERTCWVDDNIIDCWGEATRGDVPPPNPLKNPRKITSGKAHTCALDDEGIKCWGSNDLGQLNGYDLIVTPTEIAAGLNHTCVIGSSPYSGNIQYRGGLVQCFGGHEVAIKRFPENFKKPFSITSGHNFSCVIHDEGLSCWGLNERGQASPPSNLVRPRAVIAAPDSACAFDDLGIKCWGANPLTIHFDQSNFFHSEKNIPLKLAQQILENVEDTRETKSSLFYLREAVVEKFLMGIHSDVAQTIFDNSKNIRQTYKNKSLVNEGNLSIRNSTQLRFLLSIVVSSLDSSKYLLSTDSKKVIDDLKIAFANLLSEEEITISETHIITEQLLAEVKLMNEMKSSHRLVGIRAFYEWLKIYVETGKVD